MNSIAKKIIKNDRSMQITAVAERKLSGGYEESVQGKKET